VVSRSWNHVPVTEGGPLYQPILGYQQPGQKFIADTDKINVKIGGVLVQDSQEQITAYYNKMLNMSERNYCITWQELLAIVKIPEHFCKYLYRQELHLCTGHSTLTWLMSFKNLEGKMAHWILCLQEYNFTSKYRQGHKHNNADALS
jgi:hypothetical protein